MNREWRFSTKIHTSQPTRLPIAIQGSSILTRGSLESARGLQPGVQEAWGLYAEPWLALEMQGSAREPHPWTREPREADAGVKNLFDWGREGLTLPDSRYWRTLQDGALMEPGKK